MALIFNLFKKRSITAKLRPYELACLAAWKSKLSQEAIDILDRQLVLFNKFQRQSKGKLVVFYYTKDITYKSWPSNCFFPLYNEIIASTLSINSIKAGNRLKWRADITLYKGRFFSIEFNKIPKKVFQNPRSKKNKVEVTTIDILVDPMNPNPFTTPPLTDTTSLKDWLADWMRKWQLDNLRQPLSKDQKAKLLRQYDTALPEDYLELLAQTDGLKVKGWEIYGLSQIRSLVLPEISFYIIAECESKGAVAVKQGSKKGQLYYIDNEDHDVPENAGNSLRIFLEKVLGK